MLVNHDLPTMFIDTWGVTLELDIEPGRERGITRLEKAEEEARRQQSLFFFLSPRLAGKIKHMQVREGPVSLQLSMNRLLIPQRNMFPEKSEHF